MRPFHLSHHAEGMYYRLTAISRFDIAAFHSPMGSRESALRAPIATGGCWMTILDFPEAKWLARQQRKSHTNSDVPISMDLNQRHIIKSLHDTRETIAMELSSLYERNRFAKLSIKCWLHQFKLGRTACARSGLRCQGMFSDGMAQTAMAQYAIHQREMSMVWWKKPYRTSMTAATR
jgi:hypothetical protein